jgi:hypothetical protein
VEHAFVAVVNYSGPRKLDHQVKNKELRLFRAEAAKLLDVKEKKE